MHLMRALIDRLTGRQRVRTRDVVGNMIVGNVSGIVIQQAGPGPPSEEPNLPWRNLGNVTGNASEFDIFSLLTWRSRLVEKLIGRDVDRESLLRWARDTQRPVTIRLLSGPGGAGKSRLAAELAQELRAENWSSGFVTLERETSLPVTQRGIFLVIDYPEAHRDAVRLLLRRAATLERPPAPVRLLLATRQSLDWWFNDIVEARAADICDGHTVTVGALTAGDTTLLVQRASERLAKHRGTEAPALSDTEVEAWHERSPALHGLPLFATAAALHAVLDPAPTFELGGADIIAALVRRERARLDQAARLASWPEPAAASRLHGLAALRGGLDEPTLVHVAQASPDLGSPAAERIVDAVRAQGWWREGRLPPIQPDLVAAELLRQVLADRPDAAPRWLASVLVEAR
jgi:hypothetical protein